MRLPLPGRKAPSCGHVIVYFFVAFYLSISAAAQTPGVSANEIKIGSCSALDGPARQLGLQSVLGATAYFNYVNDQGGINGRKLRLASFDDGYDPEKAVTCFASLKKEQVFSGGFFVGTPTAMKYLPLAEADHLPIVGLLTGAQFLYEPVKPEIFNVRASYNDETRIQVDGLWAAGSHKIAVIYQDDGFGKAILDGVKLALAKHSAEPVATGSFVRNTLDVEKALLAVRAVKPDAVVLASPYAPAAEILKRAHAQGWRPLFLAVSFVGTEALVTAAGADAEGMVITQVVPPYDRADLPTVKLYLDCLTKYMSGTQPSFTSFEAFIDAMVITEGLRRAGTVPTRQKFVAGLESLHDYDIGLGSSRLEFSAQSHKGLSHVYPTVIRGGKPQILENWAIVATK